MNVIAFLKRTWALYLLMLPLPVIYLVQAQDMDPRSALLPRGVSIIMIALIIVVAVMDSRLTAERDDGAIRIREFVGKWWKTMGLIALMIALVSAMGWFGFYPAAAAFLLVAFTVLQVPGWIRRVVLTAGVMAGAYILFDVILGVPLP